jgi:hypothetical protein
VIDASSLARRAEAFPFLTVKLRRMEFPTGIAALERGPLESKSAGRAARYQ